jgi:hypothetical protein
MCYGEKAVTGRRLDGLCKKNSFDSIHDAADQFRELNERWNNRFTLQGQSLVEKYREGRMSVVCDFEFSRTAKWSRGAISCNGDIADNPVVSLVFCAKTEDRSYLYDWKQKPVFVEDVDIMQGPQGVIPSSVRFMTSTMKLRTSLEAFFIRAPLTRVISLFLVSKNGNTA